MQVTKHNIQQSIPIILESLQKSHIVAIDFEFTGLHYNQFSNNSSLDTINSRYCKLKYNIEKYQPIQIGICAFEVLSPKKIIAYPFNIYLCPFQPEKGSITNFNVSASAFNFLSSHGLDYNKVFNDGVYFTKKSNLQLQDQSKIIKAFKKEQRSENLGVMSLEALQLFNKYEKQIQQMLDTPSRHQISFNSKKYHSKIISKLKSLILNIKNKDNQEKYQKYMFDIQFKNQLPSSQNKNTITIKKFNKKEQEENIAQQERLKRIHATTVPKTIEQSQEIRQIFDFISENKMPLLSHNGIYDIMHLYDKFYYDMPDTIEQFNQNFNKLFPIIYDTKYMLNSSSTLLKEVKKNSSLRNAYENLFKYNSLSPKIEIGDKDSSPELQDYKVSMQAQNSKVHEAGYDAFITGFVYLQSLKILKLDTYWQDFNSENLAKKLAFFKNQIPLSGLRSTIKLDKQNEEFQEQNLFYVKFLGTQKLTVNDFKQEISKQFGEIFVYLSSSLEYEFYYYFPNENLTNQFLKQHNFSEEQGYFIKNINGIDCVIYTYKQYEKNKLHLLQSKFDEKKELDTILQQD